MKIKRKIKKCIFENQMNTHRKFNYFSKQNQKSEDFLQIFGMWIVEDIFEKSVKFRQNLVKYKSARTLNNFDDVV